MQEISLLQQKINALNSDVYTFFWVFGIIFLIIVIGILIAYRKNKARYRSPPPSF